MLFFLCASVLLASETFQNMLQDTFAYGSLVFHENMSTFAIVGAALFIVSAVWHCRRSAKSDLYHAPSIMAMNQNVSDVKTKAEIYTTLHATGGGSKEDRVEHCQEMVNQYYDLATDFYEFGWGESFHFAPRSITETFAESIARHEYFLSAACGLKPGMKALDVGCGVGGPARNIARFSGANIVGLNNNDYQIRRGTVKNAVQGLAEQVQFVKGDFMAMPFKDGEFDAVYAVEATCHAPDRVGCFSEVARVLKPGGYFCCYEWATTPGYNPEDPEHVRVKEGIEVGNSLPDVNSIEYVINCVRKAGFEVEEYADVADPKGKPEIKWYQPFEPAYTPSGFKTTPVGIWLTNVFVRMLELVRLAPAGSHKMHDHLTTGAATLHEGGKMGIFTPMLFIKARKPAYTGGARGGRR